MRRTLTVDEMDRWVAWKRASDRVWSEVLTEIQHATGLSGADFSVLTRAVEAEDPLRQQDLADDLDWSRSRLSRHLSRMEARGLVERTTTGGATTIAPTDTGKRLTTTARQAHADAVRRALLNRIGPADAAIFWETIADIARP